MLIIAGALLLHNKPATAPAKDMVHLELRPIRMANGWGYDILAGNKLYIHQDAIPAIAMQKPFATEAEALLTGNKVIEKLKNGKLPSVSVKELQMMKIHF